MHATLITIAADKVRYILSDGTRLDVATAPRALWNFKKLALDFEFTKLFEELDQKILGLETYRSRKFRRICLGQLRTPREGSLD